MTITIVISAKIGVPINPDKLLKEDKKKIDFFFKIKAKPPATWICKMSLSSVKCLTVVLVYDFLKWFKGKNHYISQNKLREKKLKTYIKLHSQNQLPVL